MSKYVNVDDEEIWDAFAKDIAEEDQEYVLETMTEAAHRSDRKAGKDDFVTILERTRHNAINVTVSGIVKYKDEEFTFHLTSGDWNGTELHAWNEIGHDYEEPVHDPLTFQPDSGLVQKAMGNDGDPKHLLKMWDLFKDRKDVQEHLRKYAYDIFFQPGGAIRNHYEPQLKQWRMEAVRQSCADETRKMLEKRAAAI